MEERKANQVKGKSLDDMMAYIDEDGNITSTPPDPEKKKVFNVEDIQIGVAKSKEIEEPLKEGRVDYFNEPKGFGFITPDDGGEDLFAHFSEIRSEGFKSLQENQKVSFEIKQGPKGKQAADIKPV